MPIAEPRVTQTLLLDLTVRLAEEFPDLPAGSVMRCVARVVRSERRHGVPEDELPARIEATARSVLRRRCGVHHSLLTAS